MFSKSIYFAGDLFDHKHLVGNQMLAEFLQLIDVDKYSVTLPQNLEQVVDRAIDVRNQDYALILESDLSLFNFDGTDLDSGTVAEFMFAKFLDLPSVILRSDFRSAGDGLKDGDPWNLMLTGFPRTTSLFWHSMSNYQQYRKEAGSNWHDLLYSSLSEEVDGAFDTSVSKTSIYSNKEELLNAYLLAIKSIGPEFTNFLKFRWNVDDTTLVKKVQSIIDKRISKGIYLGL